MGIETVGIEGLTKLQEQSIVFSLLTIIIAGLVWDRLRLLKDLKDKSDQFIAALQSNADKFANVAIDNTKAITEFKDVLKDIARGP